MGIVQKDFDAKHKAYEIIFKKEGPLNIQERPFLNHKQQK